MAVQDATGASMECIYGLLKRSRILPKIYSRWTVDICLQWTAQRKTTQYEY